MGTRLRRPSETFVPVVLTGGGVWRLRQATSIEQQIAGELAARRIIEIKASHQAVASLREMFGSILDLGDPIEPEKFNATARFLTDVELALICGDGWEGLFDDQDNPIAAPTLEWAALLLADPIEIERVRRVLYAGLHERHVEKNASAASPAGAAAAANEPAPTAAA